MKISDCRKLKVHSSTPPGLSYTGMYICAYQFTNRPGLPQDRPGTNIHPTGLFCSASYVTCTPSHPLIYPFVPSLAPHCHEKILLQRIYTLANFPCGRFLLLTTSPSPNFNHGCADLARKKHFASDKNRSGLALDRSGFHHAGLQGPIGISAYPTGHIFCFFLTSLFEGNKQPKSMEKKILLSKSPMLFHLHLLRDLYVAPIKKQTKSQTRPI